MNTTQLIKEVQRTITRWTEAGITEAEPDLQLLREVHRNLTDGTGLLRMYAFLTACIATAFALVSILCGVILVMMGDPADALAMQPCAWLSALVGVLAYLAARG